MKGISLTQNIARIGLGAFLTFAGISHMTFARKDFQAQVPDWVPMDKDAVVLISGGVEITLGMALMLLAKKRKLTGLVAASFFIAVFPGNISQYTHHRDAFGLDTDQKRLVRLFFQPALVAWALYASDALTKKEDKHTNSK